jgi:EAL domain-containing protein (putative c-di-GMP-specific phosphodiesterase class I)
VETVEQLTLLRNAGCDEIQGYLIGKPKRISEYSAITGRSGHSLTRVAAAS